MNSIVNFEYLPQNCLDMKNAPQQEIKEESRTLKMVNKSFDCYKTLFLFLWQYWNCVKSLLQDSNVYLLLLLKPRLNPCAKLPSLHLAVEPLWPSSLLEQDDLFSLILFSTILKVRLSAAAERYKCGKSTVKVQVGQFPLKKSKRWRNLESWLTIFWEFIF